MNGKKFITKLFFSVITTKKNLKWEISTKNLVTLKDGIGLRMKNVNNMGVHWKIWFLGGCMKNQYIGGVNCLKREAWIVCRFKRGLGKKEGMMFLKGVETLVHTMSWRSLLIDTNIQRK